MSFVLFDLDNTLVDSLHLKKLRDRRSWPAVYAQIPTVQLFDGVAELWEELRGRSVHLGVVTHSPRPYAERMLKHISLAPDTLIAYHDLNGKRKPSPFGYRQCAKGLDAACGVAVGDERTICARRMRSDAAPPSRDGPGRRHSRRPTVLGADGSSSGRLESYATWSIRWPDSKVPATAPAMRQSRFDRFSLSSVDATDRAFLRARPSIRRRCSR